MENVLLIGASGSIGSVVRRDLLSSSENHLTLFVRDSSRLGDIDEVRETVIAGDATKMDDLNAAVENQDVVFISVTGELPLITQNVVDAMHNNEVKRVILISSMGIYNEVNSDGNSDNVESVLIPYRKAADIVEESDLDSTVIRPSWYDNNSDLNYQITFKGETFVGRNVSRRSVADLSTRIINEPTLYVNESLGISRA
ncbi:NAD(P)H-binding protein [Companilactobacillus nodensis]|uniref:NAD-dependent epimerase dehydratase n=1 Tax=Companilactobacillus nodensis DSM 19682 = JCM 14932 = NBRC 107160 TaxID=1423775 RepID=A0A0R1K561_9LACO|nr:NAD(P)H-binding protein [Companilactobacillus nodensis]KRK78645.1 NAD-dependent epimerase dehydratase [Companilactobacillus nodensis DSM 19682 = JCM 14932 = NBRC 107160]